MNCHRCGTQIAAAHLVMTCGECGKPFHPHCLNRHECGGNSEQAPPARTIVHPRKQRPPMEYLRAGSWVEARNRSCDMMDRGYDRLPVREGFVMVPKVGAVVAILPPEFHGAARGAA